MSATDELVLSDTERFGARCLQREMDKIGLPGLSEEQCFTFKDVIAKLIALSEELRLAFKDGLAKLKPRLANWQDLQERPTLKQKKDEISKLRKGLEAILRFDRSDDKAAVAIRDILLGDYLAPELADTEKDALAGGHLDVAEWFAAAKKIDALAKRREAEFHAPVDSSKRPGPVPVGPRTRLFGMDLPSLYAKVFGRKFSPTRTPDVEFVNACLVLLGEGPKEEGEDYIKANYIKECIDLVRERSRKRTA
jgi:hypothetical protein